MKSRSTNLAATLVALIVGPTGPVGAQPAPNATSVLILDTTVTLSPIGGSPSLEAQKAIVLGLTPVEASGTT